eukprot:5989920-Amphidinium_carterae.3
MNLRPRHQRFHCGRLVLPSLNVNETTVAALALNSMALHLYHHDLEFNTSDFPIFWRWKPHMLECRCTIISNKQHRPNIQSSTSPTTPAAIHNCLPFDREPKIVQAKS